MCIEPTRVLHVFGSMNRGGAELRTLQVVERLPRSVWEFDFLALSGKAGSLEDRIAYHGMRVIRSRVRSCYFPWAFWSLLRCGKYHAVHSHVALFSGIVLTIARLAGVRVRIAHFRTTRDGRGTGWVRRIYRAAMRALVRASATDVVAVSGEVLATMLPLRHFGHQPQRLVIPNALEFPAIRVGADLDAQRAAVRESIGVPPGVPLIVHVGSHRVAKNHVRLIGIFHAASRLIPSARLLLVGRTADQLTLELQRAMVEAGISHDRVVMLGEREDVFPYLEAADVLVLPSLWEGVPGAVLEGVAMDLPVVLSDTPELRILEAVDHPIEYVPLASADEVWARALKRAIEARRSLSAGRGIAALELAGYSMESVVGSYVRLWTSGGPPREREARKC